VKILTKVIERNIYEKIEKEKVYEKLVKNFGTNYVSDKPHDLFPYSYDSTESEPGMPDFVVIPQRVEQIQNLMKFCNEYLIPVVPYITGNNVGGLTIPQEGGIICDLGKKMKKIIKVHESLMYVILEPGVTFGQLKKYLDEHHPTLKYGYTYAPPYASVIGNVLLSGLSNLSCSYGGMADWINGLEVVLNDGNTVRTGSSFISKEFKEDNWFSRYPIPDLTGLFICWQGMTGIVTKAAVQLWPKKQYNTAFVAIIYGHEACAEVLRELGRTECCEDISVVSQEYAKMQFGLKKPKKLPKEPDYALIISVSGQTKEILDAKVNYVKKVFNNIKELHPRIFLADFFTFTNILGEKFKDFYDLPSVLTALYEYDGLTWVGSYANPDNLGPLLEKTHLLYEEYEMGPIVFAKSMKAGHYCVFRPIIRYLKNSEEEKVKELQEKFLEVMLEYDCIPYKTPIWMAQKIRERCDPEWVKLFERIKNAMDPKKILNPGRWGT
jgi:FAD/FMN-containing dehydrogenase